MRRNTVLIAIPVLTYFVSYLYLAGYHGSLFLFDIVIHESGKCTFLETLFYASHFLGHIPVLIVLALLFAGVYRMTAGPASPIEFNRTVIGLWATLGSVLVGSLILSFSHFGSEDTLSFILQQKQGVNIYQNGGAWLLHLPSTITLALAIPVYVFAALRLGRERAAWNPDGLKMIWVAITATFLFTIVFTDRLETALVLALTNPRYLAHSVRELATFPLTYFPIPLYILTKLRCETTLRRRAESSRIPPAILVLAGLCVALIIYQVAVPLRSGIGHLAQKPAFAHNGTLSIPYLLASHYFEHFLDSIFFAALTVLFCLRRPR